VLLVGGLIGLGAYKLGKKDVERIEQHTGTSAEELTDEELERAMDDLQIEKQYREDSDQESGSGGETSSLDELAELGKLRDDGVLTDEEFEAKKKDILDL
jgi:hypothetical protein